jgi:hypothetical protein
MDKTCEITNTEDFFDSRDVDERIDYLEGLDELEVYEADELEALKQLREDVSSSEWQYGLTLIRDSYFEDFAQEEAEQLGLISSDMKWPYYCIDWSEAASELQMDYLSVDFDGVTYWYLMS